MPTIIARPIPDPVTGGAGVLAPPVAPAIRGDGSLDVICGACGTVLMAHVRPLLAIRRMVIRCPECGKCNSID
jgi:hypothetical protein